MTSICRICMETTVDLLPIAVEQEDHHIGILKLGIMFEECFGVVITEIPDCLRICMGCKIQLSYFHDFKQKAVQSHEKLLKLTKHRTHLESGSIANVSSRIEPDTTEPEMLCVIDGTEEESPIEMNIKVEEKYDEPEECSELLENHDLNAEYLEEDVEWCDPEIYNENSSYHEEQLECEEDPEQLPDSVTEDFASIGDESQDDFNGADQLEETIEAGTEYNDFQEDGDEEEFLEHAEKFKPKIKTAKANSKFNCEICGKNFRNIEIFTGHYNVHLGLPAYRCNICPKEFKFKVNYDYHMKNHSNSRQHKCTVCEKSCISKWDLKVHMRTHADIRPYSCEICGKSFRVRSHMTDHMETHNEENTNECPFCFQKYKTRASLKIHIATVHVKTNQFICATCGKVFYRSHHLKIHQKTHERNPKNEQNSTVKSLVVDESSL